MRILVGKTFGIGNSILCVPLIKALSVFGEVDVLVGTGPDDYGAAEVMLEFQRTFPDILKNVYFDRVPSPAVRHDVAIMAIPYDRRWIAGLHFHAPVVLDCRRRPDDVDRLGFDMWKKHEIEYMMENARVLGYRGETPDTEFSVARHSYDNDLVFLGIGYKRDAGGFGASKHFGTERFRDLMAAVRQIRPRTQFVTTGGVADLIAAKELLAWSNSERKDDGFHTVSYRFHAGGITASLPVIKGCAAYIGNDTGAMHIAASVGMPTYGLFAYPDLMVKNPPFCARSRSLLFTADGPPVEDIARDFVEFVWG